MKIKYNKKEKDLEVHYGTRNEKILGNIIMSAIYTDMVARKDTLENIVKSCGLDINTFNLTIKQTKRPDGSGEEV